MRIGAETKTRFMRPTGGPFWRTPPLAVLPNDHSANYSCGPHAEARAQAYERNAAARRRDYLMMVASTGFRRDEGSGLRPSHLDRTQLSCHIPKTKTGKMI